MLKKFNSNIFNFIFFKIVREFFGRFILVLIIYYNLGNFKEE